MQVVNLIPVLTVILLVFILKKLLNYGVIKILNIILIKIIEFISDWRTFVCFTIIWMFTNGWAYIFLIIGPKMGWTWMTIVGGTWMTILWLPITPEKLVIIPATVWLKRKLFPKHKSDTKKQQLNKTGFWV